MWHEVAKLDEIAPGGMKYVRAADREICLCEYDGGIYAVSRRCGHENARWTRARWRAGSSPAHCTTGSSTSAAA